MPDPHPLAPSPASPTSPSITPDASERAALLESARTSDSGRRLSAVFGAAALAGLSWRALARLARDEPVDPDDPSAISALIDGQARADRDAGVQWSAPGEPDPAALGQAHARLPIDLADPGVYIHASDQRHALGARLGLAGADADDLSGWALAHPDAFAPELLRAWRIGSRRWLALADAQLAPIGRVERPVGLLLAPAPCEPEWQLQPALSVDAIRLLAQLGATIGEDLRSATLPGEAAEALLERLDVRALHAGGRDALDAPARLAKALTRQLGMPVAGAAPRDTRERWGRLLVTRRTHAARDGSERAELAVRVITFGSRRFPRRRLGACPLDPTLTAASAVMELGEAVDVAVERELPLLLSPEAAGALGDRVRVARMTGRPGLLTITTLDGASANTRRLAATQAPGELRALRDAGTPVTLDAGARELVRMTLARPLADDPVLLGRQREIAALKVLGSGVDASQVGTGKTITTARAIAQRAATTARLRALVIAEGRLLAQWRSELEHGDPLRALPPLAPNVTVATLDERRPIAAQVRALDRSLGERAGVLVASNGVLDRFADGLGAIAWHLLVADEALRYANPATDAHRALARLRMAKAADCWLLTATPRGKSAEHLDVLVGLALGEASMIRERLGTREAGDLLDELHAHRLRAGYGPHLVRVTRADLAEHIPTLTPAVALALEPDDALAELLDAIRRGGHEAYRRLLTLLKQLREHEPGSPLARAALAELARVQGAVLSNVGVYLDASVDPETLRHSQAALAQALDRQGLVEPATRGGGDGLPLLRGVTSQTIAASASEQQVLVFAERVRCLRQLATTLRDRHGVTAAVGDGATRPADFEALKQSFAAGELRVLCLSRIGHEGHNLQSASVLVHLDLPWLPGGLEQRVGRAARPGASRTEIATYIPYVKGAGLEHVVSVLAPRGGEHHQILDSFEGVRAADSTIATQLAAITGHVADAKDDAGYAGTAARLRVAASVFGAAS